MMESLTITTVSRQKAYYPGNYDNYQENTSLHPQAVDYFKFSQNFLVRGCHNDETAWA